VHLTVITYIRTTVPQTCYKCLDMNRQAYGEDPRGTYESCDDPVTSSDRYIHTQHDVFRVCTRSTSIHSEMLGHFVVVVTLYGCNHGGLPTNVQPRRQRDSDAQRHNGRHTGTEEDEVLASECSRLPQQRGQLQHLTRPTSPARRSVCFRGR